MRLCVHITQFICLLNYKYVWAIVLAPINVKYNNCFQRLNMLQLDECYAFIILCVYKMQHIMLCA